MQALETTFVPTKHSVIIATIIAAFWWQCTCTCTSLIHIVSFQALPGTEHEGVVDVPLKVVNNYFSVGADAQIALQFHNERGV